MNVIEVKNLTFSYDGQKKVLDDLTFSIKQGNYTCIIGHNGSGKSTLAKLIAGLLEFKQGVIKVTDLVLNQENLPKIRKELGIVFQNPDNQFIGSSVGDDIAFGLENRQIPSKEMPSIINEYLKKVNLEKFINSEPQNLSGGQKQRVAIAGILAMKPSIIIFDEATSMLDPKGKKEIKALMRELADDQKYTIISITHDIEEVLQCDDCLVLNKGKVFKHDTPQAIFADSKALKTIGLDVPFANKVKQAFKDEKVKLKADDLKGMVEELCQYRVNH